MPPAVLQFASQICRHDAVGNAIFALDAAFRDLGMRSTISCNRTDDPWARHVRPWSSVARVKWDALLVHYSHGCAVHARLLCGDSKVILFYHGVTPPEYFRGTSPRLEEASRQGAEELSRWAERAEHAVAHSHFTARELAAAGFRKVTVLPYVPYEPLYAVEPDRSVLDRYRGDGWVNLLTVGRVAPNKCLEDCLFVFDYFKRAVHRRSRLFIVGSWEGTEAYLERLLRLAARLGTQDVFFTGPVSQATLLGFLKLADAYLCMSEHEGFGVPLLEAMRFGVPVFAYAAAAVPETLRGAGVLFSEKSWAVVAEAIGLLLADPDLRAQVISEELQQAAHYRFEAARDRLGSFLESVGILEPAGAENER